MNTQNSPLLILARSGMELSWRYAWAYFLVAAVTRIGYPLLPAVFAFGVAAIAANLSSKANWRVYQVLALQAAGFALCALLTLYPVYAQGLPFFSLEWIENLLLGTKDLLQWTVLLLMLFCQLIIWRGGVNLVKSADDHFFVCLQFDKGLGLLFFLLILKSLVAVKGGLHLQNHTVGFLALAFLIFSLVAISLARNQAQTEKAYIAGYHRIGGILSAVISTVAFVAGTALLIYPHLYGMADALFDTLGHASRPMVPYLVKLLRLWLAPNHMRDQVEMGSTTTGSGEMAPAPAEGWETVLGNILLWGAVVISLLTVLVVGTLLLKRLLDWLLTKKEPTGTGPNFLAWLGSLARAVAVLALSAWQRITSLTAKTDTTASVYRDMLGWGRRSGVPIMTGETPAEYGLRLKRSYPRLRREFRLIVDSFNRETYGQIKTDSATVARVKSAGREIKRLRHWVQRIKVWLAS